jgi:hypothetical protein
MRNYLFLLASLLSILFFNFGCGDKDKECDCRQFEDCIDGECILQEDAYYIGEYGVKGHKLYHGIVEGNTCVDTLVFIAKPDMDPLKQPSAFALYIHGHLPGVQNVAPFVDQKISDTEYIMSTAAPMCYQNGKGLYSTIRCTLMGDSVLLDMDFWTLDDPFGTPVDSCKVTLYH